MDENIIKDELLKLQKKLIDLVETTKVHLVCENKQKSEKTKKKIKRDDCRSKALYATKKYGCSGIEGSIECLECEYRR